MFKALVKRVRLVGPVNWDHYGERPLKSCIYCGTATRLRKMRLDASLRRSLKAVCNECSFAADDLTEQVRKLDRVQKDWAETTTPIAHRTIRPGELPDYEGKARRAIRAFLATDEANAVVPGLKAPVLQATINSLGLEDQLWAEQRNGKSVLRKAS